MRLYVKLAVFITSFLILAGFGGNPRREWAWEVSFAARCYVAELLEDQRLKDQLVAEARVELQRRLAVMDLMANENAPAAQELLLDRLAGQDVADGAVLAQSDGLAECLALR